MKDISQEFRFKVLVKPWGLTLKQEKRIIAFIFNLTQPCSRVVFSQN